MKEWKVKKNEIGVEWHELHFDQFYGDDEDIIASLMQDESDSEVFYYTTKEKAEEAIEVFKDELIWYFTEYVQRLDEVQNG